MICFVPPFCNWRKPFWGQNVLLSEAVYHMSYAQKNHQIPRCCFDSRHALVHIRSQAIPWYTYMLAGTSLASACLYYPRHLTGAYSIPSTPWYLYIMQVTPPPSPLLLTYNNNDPRHPICSLIPFWCLSSAPYWCLCDPRHPWSLYDSRCHTGTHII